MSMHLTQTDQDLIAPPLHPAELDVVEVLCSIRTDEGVEVPAGSRGTIVGVWERRAGYTVEFLRPTAGLADLTPDLVRVVWRPPHP